MTTIAPQYSPEEVDEAGRTLVLAGYADPDKPSEISETERLHAVNVVSQWRVSHARPLDTFRNNLRRRVGSSGIVAQRLKRLPSIVSKLERLPGIRLSRMQDIGGCRAIVTSADDAFNLAGDLTAEIRTCNEELRVIDRLSAFQRVTAQVEELRDRRVRIAVLELNLDTESVRGFGYHANDLDMAAETYRTMEEQYRGNPRVDVVLISTDSLSALRQAYPNYFADIREFRRIVREIISGQ